MSDDEIESWTEKKSPRVRSGTVGLIFTVVALLSLVAVAFYLLFRLTFARNLPL
jgi:hypothetical protein